MFSFRTNKQKFSVPSKWDEITISLFQKWMRLQNEMDEYLKEACEVEDVSKLSNIEIFTVYPEYFAKTIACFSDADENLIMKCRSNDVWACYELISGELAVLPDDKDERSFDYKGETYYFPESEFDIDGAEALAGKETFGNMVYAFQQEMNIQDLRVGRYEALPRQMAILCRKKDEPFTPELARKRAKEFENLTMDVVWKFIFFLIRQFPKYRGHSRNYLKVENKAS